MTDLFADQQPEPSIAGLVCDAADFVGIAGLVFCFTGQFSFAPREECEAETVRRGGVVRTSVTKTTEYLVVGSLGGPRQKPGDYGAKVKQAVRMSRAGFGIKIVKEQDWVAAIGRPDPFLASNSIQSQVWRGLDRLETERWSKLTPEERKDDQRAQIERPRVREGPKALCQNSDYLQLVTEFDYDLENERFRSYCQERGTLSVAGVPRTPWGRMFSEHRRTESDYRDDIRNWRSNGHLTPGNGDLPGYSAAVVQYGRATLQDSWELFCAEQETK